MLLFWGDARPARGAGGMIQAGDEGTRSREARYSASALGRVRVSFLCIVVAAELD